MRTAILFQELPGSECEFFYIFYGDLSRFNGVYINATISSEDVNIEKYQQLENELNNLIYCIQPGPMRLPSHFKTLKEFVQEAAKCEYVIMCGFIL